MYTFSFLPFSHAPSSVLLFYLEGLEVLVAIVDDGQEHVDEDEVDKEDEHQEEQGAKHLGLKIGP